MPPDDAAARHVEAIASLHGEAGLDIDTLTARLAAAEGRAEHLNAKLEATLDTMAMVRAHVDMLCDHSDNCPLCWAATSTEDHDHQHEQFCPYNDLVRLDTERVEAGMALAEATVSLRAVPQGANKMGRAAFEKVLARYCDACEEKPDDA